MALPSLEAHWSRRTRLYCLVLFSFFSKKQNNNSTTYGEVKRIYVVKRPQNSSQGLHLMPSLKPRVCIRMGKLGNPRPILYDHLSNVSLSCPSCCLKCLPSLQTSRYSYPWLKKGTSSLLPAYHSSSTCWVLILQSEGYESDMFLSPSSLTH